MNKITALIICLVASSVFADAPPVQTKLDGGNSNLLSSAFDSAVTAGNILYLAIFQADTGWTMAVGPTNACLDTFTEAPNSPITSSNGRMRIYTTKTAGGCAIMTITSSASAPYGIYFAEYSGMAASSYVECDASGTGSSTSLASGDCVTTSNNTTIVSYGAQASNTAVFTAGSGFTIQGQQGGTGHSEAAEDKNVSVSGTYTGTMTSDTNAAWAIHVLALKSADQSLPRGSITTLPGTGSIATTLGPDPIKTIASVQTVTNGSSCLAASTCAQAYNSNVTAGNLLVAGIYVGGAGTEVTVTDSLGQTWMRAVSQEQTTDDHRIFIYYSTNTLGGANTVTVDRGSVGITRFSVSEFSGAELVNAIDQTNSAQGDAGAAAASGNVTAAQNGELLFAIASNSTDATWTVGTDFTSHFVVPATSGRLAGEYYVQPAAAAHNGNGTWDSSVNWAAAIATFKAAPLSRGSISIVR